MIPFRIPHLSPHPAQVLAFETLALVSDGWSLNSPGLGEGGCDKCPQHSLLMGLH